MSEQSAMRIEGAAVVGTEMYNTVKRFVVPDGIAEIGPHAFTNCTYHLEEVVLPDSIESIGESAFFYCKALKHLRIPTKVRRIGRWAFGGTALSCLEIPDGVKRIEEFTFCGSPLKSVVLPDTIEYIGQSAFENTGLTSIYLPKSVTAIERDAFKNCRDLIVYCEGVPASGWVDSTVAVTKKEYFTTAEDDAFNFHRSSGGFTSHICETEVQEKASWNPDGRPIFTDVSREQYRKMVEKNTDNK